LNDSISGANGRRVNWLAIGLMGFSGIKNNNAGDSKPCSITVFVKFFIISSSLFDEISKVGILKVDFLGWLDFFSELFVGKIDPSLHYIFQLSLI
jgi:hypothetical protein